MRRVMVIDDDFEDWVMMNYVGMVMMNYGGMDGGVV